MIRKGLVVLFFLVVQSVRAETMLDIIQARVGEGDATAQVLIGLMYENGYIFEQDAGKAEKWYKKAQDNGDSFAATRLNTLKNPPKSDRTKFGSGTTESAVEKVITAELVSGTVDIEDLIRDRSEYLGKVVKLKFGNALFHGSGPPVLTVWGSDHSFYQHMSIPNDKDAIDWGLKVGRGSGTVYVYVESRRLHGVGIRKKKNGAVTEYTW